MAKVRASLVGIAAACVAAAIFAMLSSFALSDARLAEVVQRAFDRGELAWAARTKEDFFTECALLEMQQLRQRGMVRSAFDTRFLIRENEHPCDTLRVSVLGTAKEKASLPAAISYVNYPFGSRHLEALVLSAIDYGSATQLYRVLSYGSVALLFLVLFWRTPATAMALAPIPLLLFGAFALHRFGGNLSHAPGFFSGFLALALFVGMPRWFHGMAARLAFAGMLGVLATYFDLLNGVIVTLLALTIVLNHFYYVAGLRDGPDYVTTAASQACAIFACFLTAYLTVTLARLGILWLCGVDVSIFVARLESRTATDIGIPLTFGTNMERLFAARFQLMPSGAIAASWTFVAGIAGWIFAGLIGLATFALRRRLQMPTLVDVLVLAVVSLGVLAWYWIFTAHTFVHALFVVRLLAVALACGLAAAILAFRQAQRDHLPAAIMVGSLVVAPLAAVLLLHKHWTFGTDPNWVEARFVDATADLVSCNVLGLRPDGRPDGIIEVRFEKPAPPLSYIGVSARDRAHIKLLRSDPPGAHHTGMVKDVLGIASQPGGALLNGITGIFTFTAGHTQHIYAHFCRDGQDRASSIYEVSVDDVAVPIAAKTGTQPN